MNAISGLLSASWSEALGWTLLHSLWQGALVAVIIGLVMVFLKKASSRLRYLLYSMGLLLIVGTSIITFLKFYNVNSEPVSSVISYQSSETGKAPLVLITDVILNNTNNTSLKDIKNWFSGYFSRNLPVLVGIWLLGILVFFLRFIGGMAYTQRLKYYRTNEIGQNWNIRFDRLAKNIGLKSKVRFIESYLVKSPVVINNIKPFVILPAGMLLQIPAAQLDAIIAHELAHIYRKDYLINILQNLIEIIFFYHPAVWWLSSNIRMERENICDDIAIEHCGDSLAYAKALTAARELQVNTGVMAPAFSNKKNLLLNRIQRMMKKQRLMNNYAEGFISAIIVILGIAAISATAAISFDPDDKGNFLSLFNPIEKYTESIQPLKKRPSGLLPGQQEQTLYKFPDSVKKVEKKVLKLSDSSKIEIVNKGDSVYSIKIDGKEVNKDEFDKYSQIETGGGIYVTYADDEDEASVYMSSNGDSIDKKMVHLRKELNELEGKRKELIVELKRTLSKNGERIEEIDDYILDINADLIVDLKDEIEDIKSDVIFRKFYDSDDNGYNYLFRYPGSDSLNWHFGDSSSFSWKVLSLPDSLPPMPGEWNVIVQGNLADSDQTKVFLDNIIWHAQPDIDSIHDEARAEYFQKYEKAMQEKEIQKRKIEEMMRKRELEIQEMQTKIIDRERKMNQYINTPQFDSKTDRIVRKELEEDGLINSGEKDVIVELDNRRMYINGDKQSKSNYKKYRQLVESMINTDLGNDFHYKLVF